MRRRAPMSGCDRSDPVDSWRDRPEPSLRPRCAAAAEPPPIGFDGNDMPELAAIRAHPCVPALAFPGARGSPIARCAGDVSVCSAGAERHNPQAPSRTRRGHIGRTIGHGTLPNAPQLGVICPPTWGLATRNEGGNKGKGGAIGKSRPVFDDRATEHDRHAGRRRATRRARRRAASGTTGRRRRGSRTS